MFLLFFTVFTLLWNCRACVFVFVWMPTALFPCQTVLHLVELERICLLCAVVRNLFVRIISASKADEKFDRNAQVEFKVQL